MSIKTHSINLLQTNISFEASDKQFDEIADILSIAIINILTNYRVIPYIANINDNEDDKIFFPYFIDDNSLKFISINLFSKNYTFQASEDQLSSIAESLKKTIVKILTNKKITPIIRNIQSNESENITPVESEKDESLTKVLSLPKISDDINQKKA